MTTNVRHGSTRKVVVAQPGVVWVDPTTTASRPTGERASPFARVADAITLVRRRRDSREASTRARYRWAEIRIVPSDELPEERAGVRRDGIGSVAPWFRWWTGQSGSVRDWYETVLPDRQRDEICRATTGGIVEDLRIRDLERVRFVNAAYAIHWETLGTLRGVHRRAEVELARLPMVTFLPPGEVSSPYRVDIDGCSDLVFEGIHWLGCAGQTGLSIRRAQRIALRRCWIECFAGAESSARGVHSVGRAIQLEAVGEEEGGGIEMDRCDIGFNVAWRPGMTVRGAAVMATGSRITMRGCLVHDNRASDTPADLAYDRASRVDGSSDNHRDRNGVLGRAAQ